jgi:hypothetical protein
MSSPRIFLEKMNTQRVAGPHRVGLVERALTWEMGTRTAMETRVKRMSTMPKLETKMFPANFRRYLPSTY